MPMVITKWADARSTLNYQQILELHALSAGAASPKVAQKAAQNTCVDSRDQSGKIQPSPYRAFVPDPSPSAE